MPIFSPNSGKPNKQDIGGIYNEPCGTPKHFDEKELPIEESFQTDPMDCCDEFCVKDQNGVQYPFVNGCFIIPSNPDCCPSALDYSGNLLTLTYIDSSGNPQELTTIIEVPSGTGISSVSVSGCLGGDGSPGDPLYITLDPNGNILCGDSGLYTSVQTSGCLTGDGTPTNPLEVQIQQFGGIFCGPNGLYVSGVAVPSGSVLVGSCLTGNGSGEFPIELVLAPNGNLTCGPSGLQVSGIESTVNVSGCLDGDGTSGNPIVIGIDPDGGIQCGPSGLRLTETDASGCCTVYSYEDGNAPSGATAPTTPTDSPVETTVQTEVWNDCIRFWYYESGGWTLDKEFCATDNDFSGVHTNISGCLVGDGTSSSPLSIKLHPLGGITCGPNGLAVSGIVEVDDLIPVSVCYRETFELGKIGTVSVDTDQDAQPVRPISSIKDLTITEAIATLGTASTTAIDVDVLTGGSPSGPWSVLESFTMSSGVDSVTINGLQGEVLSAGSFISHQITTGGDGKNLNIVIFGENCEAVISGVVTDPLGCLTGAGVSGSPLGIKLQDGGGIVCGISGLSVSGFDSTVYVSGCLIGDGSTESPIQLSLKEGGNLFCGPSGLYVSGIDPNVYVSGCLTGNGTTQDPISIVIDPEGGITCEQSGLRISQGSVIFSFEDGLCNTTGVQPASVLPYTPPNSVQTEVWNGCINYWSTNSGGDWILEKTYTGCCPSALDYEPTGHTLTLYYTDHVNDLQTLTTQIEIPAVSGIVGALSSSGVNLVYEPGDFSEPDIVNVCQLITDNCDFSTSLQASGSSLIYSGFDGTVNIINLCPVVSGCQTAITEVSVSGCIEGAGVPDNPITIKLDPSGGLSCTADGLGLQGGGCCAIYNYEDGNAPGSQSEPNFIPSGLENGAIIEEVWDNQINYWVLDGETWVLDKTFSGSGGPAVSGAYSTITVNESGFIHNDGQGNTTGVDVCSIIAQSCPTSGTSPSGCDQMTLVSLDTSGSGTTGDPYTTRNLVVTQPCASSGVTVDLRAELYFELGQGGDPLFTDSNISGQHRFVVPDGYQIEVCNAIATLATPGDTNTQVEFYASADVGGSAPAGTLVDTLTIPSGYVRKSWSNINGTYGPLTHIQERVSSPGVNASMLNLQIWYKKYPCP